MVKKPFQATAGMIRLIVPLCRRGCLQNPRGMGSKLSALLDHLPFCILSVELKDISGQGC